MTVHTVTTVAQFNTAIGAAVAGDRIEIATNTALSNLSISNKNFGAGITITSASGYDAVIDTLSVNNSIGITIENLTLQRNSGAQTSDDAGRFTNCDYITITGCKIISSVDGNSGNNYSGVDFIDSSFIAITDNEFHDLRSAIVVNRSDNITIENNVIHNMSGDGMTLGQLDTVAIRGNFAYDFNPAPGFHNDFIQFYTTTILTTSHNIEITGNVLLSPDALVQGIFIDSDNGALFSNVLISENVIYTKAQAGISLSGGEDSEISNNTVIGPVGDSSAARISLTHATIGGSVVTMSDNVTLADNIATGTSIPVTGTNYLTGNVDIQFTNPHLANYVGNLFLDPLSGAVLDDVRPVPGWPIAAGKGATDPYAASPPPVAYIGHTAGSGPSQALTQSFSAADWDGTVPGGTTYSWDFGDGVTAEGASVAHRFATPGEHTVSLTINTPGVGSVTVDKKIVVEDPKLLDLRFDNDPAVSGGTDVLDASTYNWNVDWMPDASADAYVTGPNGGLAASFNNGPGYVFVPNSPKLEGQKQLTIALDVNVDTIATDRIFEHFGTIGLDIQSDGKLKAYVWLSNGTQANVVSSSQIAADTWHSVTVVFDGNANPGAGTGSLSLYVDGVSRGVTTGIGTQLATHSHGIRIGAGQSSGNLDGDVDNVRLYNGAFGPSDLAVLEAYLANTAPTDIALGGDGVYERATAGTIVGALSTTDAGDTATYTLAPGSSSFFAISGSNLVVASGANLDYETTTSHNVIVRATDSAGNVRQETITVAVKDAIEFPSGGGTLSGTAGSDLIYGGAGNDQFNADAGADTFSGGSNTDTANYGSSTGAVVIDMANPLAGTGDGAGDVFIAVERILGTAFNDSLASDGSGSSLFGQDGTDTLDGRGGNDALFGGGGADYLTGGDGNDIVHGGGGGDTLIGNAGADTLEGVTGNDTFLFNLGEANGDRIVDFTGNGSSAGDVLQFTGFGVGASLSNVGDQWTVTYTGGSETFTLVGVTSLDPSDYVFV